MALNRFPGPWYARLIKWPMRYYEARSKREEFVVKLHKRYGPVVQIAPRTLSINGTSELRQLFAPTNYLSRPEPLPFFHSHGSENLVSTVDGDLHRDRRKILRTIYSASVVDSPNFQAVIQESVKRFLKFISKNTGPVDTRAAFRRLAYDIMSHLVYGSSNASNVLDKDYQHGLEFDINWDRERSNQYGTLFMIYFPNLTMWLRRMNLAPSSIDGLIPSELAIGKVGCEALEALKTATDVLSQLAPGSEPLIHRLYRHHLNNDSFPEVPSEGYILSECFDHFWAGVDTTTGALVPLVEHLSMPNNKYYQSNLQEDINNLRAEYNRDSLSNTELKQSQYLNAAIRETLRFNAPIGVNLDRQTPSIDGAVSLGELKIPTGWTVGASPFVVGRNEDVFPEGEKWTPERWMKNDTQIPTGIMQAHNLAMMKKHFLAFGAGPRMCIGINVAWAMMRATVASIYQDYETELEDSLPMKGIRESSSSPLEGGSKIIFRKRSIG